MASALVMTMRTARTHVERILNTLGLHCRAQLAIGMAGRNVTSTTLE
jgi:DNA-binding NarL/FixJ family response regulator